jgi:hypothetical protein
MSMDINQQLKNAPVDCGRGSPMGRPDWGTIEHRYHPMMMYLQRIKFIDGDYDLGGAYWGGHPSAQLWCGWAENIDARAFVRAKNRESAKEAVRLRFPNAKFSGNR